MRCRMRLLAGLALSAIGLSYIATVTPGRAAAFAWLPDVVKEWQIDAGILLLVAGVGLLVALVVHRFKTWAATLAVVALVLWALVFLVAWIVDLTHGKHDSTQWVSVISYGTWAALLAESAIAPRQTPIPDVLPLLPEHIGGEDE